MNDIKKRSINLKKHIISIGISPNKFKPIVIEDGNNAMYGKLDSLINNVKNISGRLISNFYSSNNNIEIDAKIMHRKKRDGD